MRVGAHRVDDVLRVGPRARIVVDLGADRIAHPAPQALADDRGVRHVDAGGLGGAVEVARLGELERAADEIDGGRVLEGEVVHVVGDHQEARVPAPARMVEPQEQHPRRERQRPFLGVRFVLALGVAVRVGDREEARVALGVVVQLLVVRVESRSVGRPSAARRGLRRAARDRLDRRLEAVRIKSSVIEGVRSRPARRLRRERGNVDEADGTAARVRRQRERLVEPLIAQVRPGLFETYPGTPTPSTPRRSPRAEASRTARRARCAARVVLAHRARRVRRRNRARSSASDTSERDAMRDVRARLPIRRLSRSAVRADRDVAFRPEECATTERPAMMRPSRLRPAVRSG